MIGCEKSILKQVRGQIRTAGWQQEKKEKEKNELSQRPPATSPLINRAREQAEWKGEKGVETNEPTQRPPATTSSIFLLNELKASEIYSAYLEACEARRKHSKNGI